MPKIVRTKVEFEGEVRERLAVVEEDHAPVWGADPQRRGHFVPYPRIGAEQMVTGSATYTADVQLPGMLHCRILRSPFPHAEIESIDVSQATNRYGLRAVLTNDNAPAIRWWGDSWLFGRVVRYQGDEVAAVAADDEETAEDALGLIRVRYRELPFVVEAEEALKPEAPKVHGSGNVVGGPAGEMYERGDVDKGFAKSDLVLEERYETQAAVHNSFEPHCCVAKWEGDELVLWDSTQHVYGIRDEVAAALGLPLANVRVICSFMGGGFGSKQGVGKHEVIAALLARQTGRPVKLVFGRRSENLAGGVRHPTVQHLKAGVRKDGRLMALQLRSIANIGAYGMGSSEVGGPVRELYRCPNVRTQQLAVYTNLGPSTAFRAPGYMEGMYALESMMDQVAHSLGIDPLKLRMLNYADKDPMRGASYSSKPLDEAFSKAASLIGWTGRAKGRQDGPKRRGMGMASQIWGGGGGPPAYAIIRLNSDGTADLLTGTQDIGTGTKTVLTQIAAEELGFKVEDIRITVGDTRAGPYAPVSAGSMTLPSMGPAVRAAARQAREELVSLSSDLLRVPRENLSVRHGKIRSTSPASEVDVSEITGRIGDFTIMGQGAREPNPENVKIRTFGAQLAEVEVDIQTGEVTVLRVVAVHDFGRVINPLTLSSQIEGGVIQGTGFALMEERFIDPESGKSLNANLEAYKIPTMLDVPTIDYSFIDRPDEMCNSIGAKGAGEPPIIPTAAAIANAVFDATGVRIKSLPITREKMLEASGVRGRGSGLKGRGNAPRAAD
ncbi:MAG: xanthine dehydrogenase family protein molybdopterin-binding subunit [Chloroflexi bacterium]|nr:xanthine dehydrogenase family protein molybdopterin-binding subunit [Chloroflexota bacterium]